MKWFLLKWLKVIVATYVFYANIKNVVNLIDRIFLIKINPRKIRGFPIVGKLFNQY